MPRGRRVLVEGGLYHVYNRFARGEGVFVDPEEAVEFSELLREVKQRDGLTVYAWALLSNHYHIAVRTSAVPLSRSMQRLQGGFAKKFNRQMAAIGPTLAESISSTRDRLPGLLRTGHPLHTPQSSTGWVGGRPCRLRLLRAPGACEENPRSPCRRGPRVDRFREHLERGEEALQRENSSRHGRESVRGVGGDLRTVGAKGSRPVCPRADLH